MLVRKLSKLTNGLCIDEKLLNLEFGDKSIYPIFIDRCAHRVYIERGLINKRKLRMNDKDRDKLKAHGIFKLKQYLIVTIRIDSILSSNCVSVCSLEQIEERSQIDRDLVFEAIRRNFAKDDNYLEIKLYSIWPESIAHYGTVKVQFCPDRNQLEFLTDKLMNDLKRKLRLITYYTDVKVFIECGLFLLDEESFFLSVESVLEQPKLFFARNQVLKEQAPSPLGKRLRIWLIFISQKQVDMTECYNENNNFYLPEIREEDPLEHFHKHHRLCFLRKSIGLYSKNLLWNSVDVEKLRNWVEEAVKDYNINEEPTVWNITLWNECPPSFGLDKYQILCEKCQNGMYSQDYLGHCYYCLNQGIDNCIGRDENLKKKEQITPSSGSVLLLCTVGCIYKLIKYTYDFKNYCYAWNISNENILSKIPSVPPWFNPEKHINWYESGKFYIAFGSNVYIHSYPMGWIDFRVIRDDEIDD
ncbi:DgyrCDS4461 [Dimorphilus gyrociliatus]|uniref:DgyrCDS4461 n=1 Tax=Dimorphilus gyrociliatus TaxID=2664684 RepID=A0A7I8VJB2_9ANNE|nr:DgyrCDS4461 [Dimorphilus gyrociliatus]